MSTNVLIFSDRFEDSLRAHMRNVTLTDTFIDLACSSQLKRDNILVDAGNCQTCRSASVVSPCSARRNPSKGYADTGTPLFNRWHCQIVFRRDARTKVFRDANCCLPFPIKSFLICWIKHHSTEKGQRSTPPFVSTTFLSAQPSFLWT